MNMLLDFINRNWIKKLKQIFESREILSKKDFLKEMSKKGYEETYSLILYDAMCDFLPSKFLIKNIYPKDNVLLDYDIDEEDIGDIMKECFKTLNIDFPDVGKQNKFYKKHGDDLTVEKLIMFIQYFTSDKR